MPVVAYLADHKAATNSVVREANRTMLIYVYDAVTLFCLLTFRSWRAVLVAVLPLNCVGRFCGPEQDRSTSLRRYARSRTRHQSCAPYGEHRRRHRDRPPDPRSGNCSRSMSDAEAREIFPDLR